MPCPIFLKSWWLKHSRHDGLVSIVNPHPFADQNKSKKYRETIAANVLFFLVCVAASISKVSKWNIHIWNFVQTHPPTKKFYCVAVQKLPRDNLIQDNLNFSITSPDTVLLALSIWDHFLAPSWGCLELKAYEIGKKLASSCWGWPGCSLWEQKNLRLSSTFSSEYMRSFLASSWGCFIAQIFWDWKEVSFFLLRMARLQFMRTDIFWGCPVLLALSIWDHF